MALLACMLACLSLCHALSCGCEQGADCCVCLCPRSPAAGQRKALWVFPKVKTQSNIDTKTQTDAGQGVPVAVAAARMICLCAQPASSAVLLPSSMSHARCLERQRH
jgi:hypothetical protein